MKLPDEKSNFLNKRQHIENKCGEIEQLLETSRKIKSFSDKTGKPVSEIEAVWNKALKIVENDPTTEFDNLIEETLGLNK